MQRTVAVWLLVALASGVALAGAAGVVAAQEDTPTATPIDQHVDPDNASESGDVDRLSAWLGSHLAGRLEGSAIQLSEGQYERADGLLSEDLEDRLEQYVEVAGETDGTADDRAASTASETVESQRELTDAVSEYRETLSAYREARERGDATEARRLAHELEELADEIRERGGEVRDAYRAIGNDTGADVSDGVGAIETVTENVTATQEMVRQETFVETTLSVSTDRADATFDDPVTIAGRLTVANGTAVANRSVRFAINERVHAAETDDAGRFSFEYRPVLARVDASAVTVSYVPRPESAYLGTSANASLDVEQVTPTVEVSTPSNPVAYGESFAIETTVVVDGRSVDNVPVGVTVGGTVLGESTTGTEATAVLDGNVTADLESGERPVRGSIALSDIAIGEASDEGTLSVSETETGISVEGTVEDDQVVAEGRIVTADGDAVGDQDVTLTFLDRERTVTTGSNGSFEGTFDLASGDGSVDAGNHTLSATFDGGGTNLAGAGAEATVVVPGASGPPWTLLGVTAVLLLGSILAWRFRSGQSDRSVPTPIAGGGSGSVEASGGTGDAERWLERARDARDRGDARGAVARAYAASYAGLRARFDLGGEMTPRELLAAAEGRIDESVVAALAAVTTAHERTTFASADEPDARDAVAEAERVVGTTEGTETVADGGHDGSTAESTD